MTGAIKPTREALEAARDGRLPDVIDADLLVLFVGINPSLYSAAVGHHFARPGNRFWPALHRAGFTPRPLHPSEDRTLLDVRLGLTNLVPRATARADELEPDELVRGGRSLVRKLHRFRPRAVAMVGVAAYRIAFGDRNAVIGRQAGPLGPSDLWVLPNPSGLNAHYLLPDLARLYGELRASILGQM